MRKLRFGKFGLTEDPRRYFVRMEWKGRVLLGNVAGVRRDETLGATILTVRHFNGEPWPVEPGAGSVFVID